MNPGERHAEYFALIPAYLSHQLSTAQSAAADLHFQQCDECAEELQYVGGLHEHFQRRKQTENFTAEVNTEFGVDADWLNPSREQENFDRLWSRIEYNTKKAEKISRRRWLPLAAAAVLLVAIALHKNAYYQQMLTPEYKTLADSNAHTACGQLRIRFIDNFSTSDMRSLLQSVDAHIVDGPTPHGVYTLRTSESATAVLEKLHLHPAVALVEPTDC